jgi:hypothetical protein
VPDLFHAPRREGDRIAGQALAQQRDELPHQRQANTGCSKWATRVVDPCSASWQN